MDCLKIKAIKHDTRCFIFSFLKGKITNSKHRLVHCNVICSLADLPVHQRIFLFSHQQHDTMNITFNPNEDWMKLQLSEMKQRLEKIKLGGGKKAIDKQREKNKLTARERIEYLCDKNKPF